MEYKSFYKTSEGTRVPSGGDMKDATELTCELYCDEVYDLVEFIDRTEDAGISIEGVKEVRDKLRNWFVENVRGDNT